MILSPSVTKTHHEIRDQSKNSGNENKKEVDHGNSINLVNLLF